MLPNDSLSLPDPLVYSDGTRIQHPDQWRERRTELLHLFSQHLYGFAPKSKVTVTGRSVGEPAELHKDTAVMRQVALTLTHKDRSLNLDLLLILPKHTTQPAPLFLGLNFMGNHTVHLDPRILRPLGWSPNCVEAGIVDHHPTDLARGYRASRWPVEDMVSRGYGLATVYSGDIDPDFDDGFRNGVHGLFSDDDYDVPPKERWGAISAWAWGLSRVLDYLQTLPEVASDRVMALGHSRLGKTALWAAAQDERFAAAFSNNSGCGGASLFRHHEGEQLHNMIDYFPHWLNARSRAYRENVEALPVDQHELLALIAPRPVYVASAAEDLWADPEGEFLSLVHANPVYRLLGQPGLGSTTMPPPGSCVTGCPAYHIREGKHELTSLDWAFYMDFASIELMPSKDHG